MRWWKIKLVRLHIASWVSSKTSVSFAPGRCCHAGDPQPLDQPDVRFHQEIAVPLIWSHSINDLDWNELSDLYRAAPLGNKNPAALKTAFTNSMFKCFVYEGGKIIGVGRALADGTDCSYICDVAVLPTHQGTGLGKQIVAKLVSMSSGHKKIILYVVPGKESFYKKLGFKRMTTAMAIFENQDQALERGYVNET
jgi:ribosomal protein S18 acetylase RimI-like enzyme